MNTELVDRVAEVVKSIPSGRVMTYGEVARFVGTNALTVGRILNAHGHKFSWWRVVDASGRPYAGALERARAHFREESTPLISGASGVQVDLAQASWLPLKPIRQPRRLSPDVH